MALSLQIDTLLDHLEDDEAMSLGVMYQQLFH